MKKILIVVLFLVGALSLAGLVSVGVAYAKDTSLLETRNTNYMMTDGDEGPMHDYMVEAFAEAVGLTPSVLETRLDAGETMYQIAVDQGIAEENIRQLLSDARAKAIEAALADGVIDQEQADWMKSHGFGQAIREPGFGRPGQGFCDRTGERVGSGMHRGGRGQQANP